MTETISHLGLLVSLLLPWLAGCALVRLSLSRSSKWNWCIVVGHGYLLGVFATTLLLRLWSATGLALNFWPIAGLLSALAITAILAQRSLPQLALEKSAAQSAAGWQRAVILVLLALLAWRYLTLLQELLTRPLYAWDAWMNWAPKAIVWFHHNELTEFVRPGQWLQQANGAGLYTLGNEQANPYPPSVPLILLWTMQGAGQWDSTYIYLPWLAAPVCLGLALYGHLRLAGATSLYSMVICYMLLSMPYLNVHAVLAGYADIWLAAAFAAAVFCLYQWETGREWPYAVLCLVFALFCTQLKVPGVISGAIVLLALLRSWLDLPARIELLLSTVLVAIIGYVLVFGIDLELPMLGHFSLGRHGIEAPLFGSFKFAFHPVTPAFINTLFLMINWNIAWYALVVLAGLALLRTRGRWTLSSSLLAVLLALAFVLFVFYFTRHHVAATNFVTLNRALLHPLPAVIFYLAAVVLSQHLDSKEPHAAATASTNVRP